MAPVYLAGNSGVPVSELSNGAEDIAYLGRTVRYYADTTAALTIGEISGMVPSAFVAAGHPSLNRRSGVIWYRVEVRNTYSETIEKAVFVQPEILEVWYHDSGAETFLVQEIKGRFTTPGSPGESDDFQFFNMKVLPGKSVVFYLRTRGTAPPATDDTAMIGMPNQKIWEQSVMNAVFHYFYLGIMVMFGSLSFFSAILFRKTVFVSFGMLMFIFGIYFIFLSSSHEPLFAGDPPLGRHLWMVLLQVGLFINFVFFISDYLNLRQDFPGHYRVLAIVTLLLLIWGTYHNLVLMDDAPSLILVFARLGWVIFSFYLIIKLAWGGLKAARVLAAATSLLFAGTILNLLPVFNLLPHGSVFSHAFQISTVFFAAIIFRELFVVFSDLRRQREQLAEASLLKSRFFANITHEFRTPLTLMLAPLRQVINRTEATDNRQLLQLAERNAERQLALVDQLLDLARLDASALELRAAPTDLGAYLLRTHAAYESLADQQDITLRLAVPATPVVAYIDEEKVDRIILNLLSNAFKFTPAGGEINVALTQDAGEVTIAVEDNGRGISPELLPHVFDRFFLAGTSKTDSKGSGIGLALVREMVRLHYGEVHVASPPGQGAMFMIKLPLGKDHLKPEEIVSATPPPPSPSATMVNAPQLLDQPLIISTATDPSDRPSVLLIEDNKEMSAFIEQMLAPAYNITTAANGARGIRSAFASPPDLVISDLMMPEKNGYEVCQALKTDLRTSHVPVILLTARASSHARLTGLEEGADDYLTKPFDARELLARAANLIRSRRVLRERFAASITVQPSEIAGSNLDQDFLTKVMEYIEANLSDGELSVDRLSAVLGTSRTQLNLKLRALVNQSTNQFIKSVRLQRAAQLLRQTDATAKEVGYSCGFNSPAYFARAFKAEFGVSPGQYPKAKSEEGSNP